MRNSWWRLALVSNLSSVVAGAPENAARAGVAEAPRDLDVSVE
jgi:hypothetical protein